jgi:hypothetical protein
VSVMVSKFWGLAMGSFKVLNPVGSKRQSHALRRQLVQRQ